MAINTPKPISRDERYLSKIGGNEEVIVPKPISREEKYMYRAAGYDDQPIPDYPIGRNEKYWAKIIENGGGSGNGSTVTFDSGQKFISDNSSLKDYKIYGNREEIHSTGILPLTFIAKGGNEDDWSISGNDEPGENLYGVNASVSISTVSAVCSGSEIAIEADGTNNIISATAADWKNNLSINLSAGSYGYKIERTGTTTGIVTSIYDANNTSLGSSQTSGTFTLPEDTSVYMGFYIPANTTANGTIKLMITKGSTAPDHYIPYQQGVGERTANLLDAQAYEVGKAWDTSINVTRATETLTVKPNTSYTLKVFETVVDRIYICVKEDADATTAVSGRLIVNETVTITTTASAYTLAIQLNKNTAITLNDCQNCKITLTEGSTAPAEYVPYGYEIPISVQGKNLFDIRTMIDPDSAGKYLKNNGTIGNESGFAYTTYIPIVAQRVRLDNVTGGAASICCYDANKNFIRGQQYYQQSVILLNTSDATFVRFSLKPATESNTALFGLNDYTFYIGNTPLIAGQSISKTSTGVDIELFEGENTVSTTLYNKPTMEIEASYGVGVKDNNHYIIPFKVNTTIYNIQIGDSPLYDGEYLSYKEKKLYKYIDSVLTPIDPPSPFPEISTTEGVNKVIIETSTQPDSIFITTQNPIKLVQPNIGTKTITQNGVYNASDDNLDGYSSVTVNTN